VERNLMKIIYYIKKWTNIRTHEKTLYSRVEARDPKALASRWCKRTKS